MLNPSEPLLYARPEVDDDNPAQWSKDNKIDTEDSNDEKAESDDSQ